MNIGIIGCGEVGKIFAAALANQPSIAQVAVWDARWHDAPPNGADEQALQHARVFRSNSVAELCAQAELIFSAVTASDAFDVAEETAKYASPNTIFIDLNSASPGTKKRGAAVLSAAAAHYVDAGVMTSVPTYGIRVPILLGGPHATSVAETLRTWGMDVKVVSDQIGVASAIKMSRSIMIKGLEALVIESYTTARAYGVEDFVLPTLTETFPSIDWEKQGDYFFSRVVQHGKRRAEEMAEAANTVREGVLEPIMTEAISKRQAWVAAQRANSTLSPDSKSWRAHADALIALSNKTNLP